MSWIALIEAVTKLQVKHPWLDLRSAMEMTEHAVRSGQPFVRGIADGKITHEMIGERIKNDANVDVVPGIVISMTRWWNVQVLWELFLEYVETNLMSFEVSRDRRTSLTRRGRAQIEKNAKKFVAKYIADEKAAGRRPTLGGLETAASEAGLRGVREVLRTTLRQKMELKRGRPPTKSAKK
jgi:hypothetical protein